MAWHSTASGCACTLEKLFRSHDHSLALFLSDVGAVSEQGTREKDAEGYAFVPVNVHAKNLQHSSVNELSCHASSSTVNLHKSVHYQCVSGVSQAYIDAGRGQLACEAAVGPPEVSEGAQWMLYAYESLPGSAFVQLTRKRSCSNEYRMPLPSGQLTHVLYK